MWEREGEKEKAYVCVVIDFLEEKERVCVFLYVLRVCARQPEIEDERKYRRKKEREAKRDFEAKLSHRINIMACFSSNLFIQSYLPDT